MAEKIERLSVTFPSRLAQRVRQAAGEGSETISGWLCRAAEHRLRLEAGRALLAEYEAAQGPVTAEERAAIDAEVAAARSRASGGTAPHRGWRSA